MQTTIAADASIAFKVFIEGGVRWGANECSNPLLAAHFKDNATYYLYTMYPPKDQEQMDLLSRFVNMNLGDLVSHYIERGDCPVRIIGGVQWLFKIKDDRILFARRWGGDHPRAYVEFQHSTEEGYRGVYYHPDYYGPLMAA